MDLKYLFRVSNNSVQHIVLERCKAIYTLLKDEYLKIKIWHEATAKSMKEMIVEERAMCTLTSIEENTLVSRNAPVMVSNHDK